MGSPGKGIPVNRGRSPGKGRGGDYVANQSGNWTLVGLWASIVNDPSELPIEDSSGARLDSLACCPPELS